MPGSTEATKPVIMLPLRIVRLIQEAVICRILPAGNTAPFKFTVPVVQICISIDLATAIIDIATCLITTIRIGSRLYTSVIAWFAVIF